MRGDPRGLVWLRWRQLLLVLVLLVPGTPEVVARFEAARNLRDRLGIEAASGGVANSFAAPALMQAAPPLPSGAVPPYPLNHTFDAERYATGTPPSNHGFEDAVQAMDEAQSSAQAIYDKYK